MIKGRKIEQGEKIIFLYTGGAHGLYTKYHSLMMEEELIGGITIIE